MDGDLERRVAALERRLDRIERRLTALAEASGEVLPLPEEERSPAPAGAGTPGPAAWLALSGRTLVVLAGAFAWRALTESGVLPQAAGTALGIVYALVWLLAADLAASSGRRLSANFHGLATALIAFPLVAEATAKFRYLTPAAGAVTLAIAMLAALALAWRRDLRGLAWTMTAAGVLTAWSLAVATQSFVPFALDLVLASVATLWLGHARSWTVLSLLTTYVTALTLFAMSAIYLFGPTERVLRLLRPDALAAAELLLLASFTVGYALLALVRRTEIGTLETAQLAATAVVALGAGTPTLVASGTSTVPAALAGLVLAALCYGTTFALGRRTPQPEGARLAFATLGLTLLIWSGALLAGPAALALVLAAAGAALMLGAGGGRRALVALQGAGFLLAASAASGLLVAIYEGLFAPVPAGRFPLLPLAVLAGLAAGSSAPAGGAPRGWRTALRIARLLLLALAFSGAAALAVLALRLALAGADGSADPAHLATLRTAALALCAVAAATAGRTARFLEAGWLLYPLLAAGGVKLLAEDLRVGRPGTLVLSLALYGGALILAPRLARRAAGRR